MRYILPLLFLFSTLIIAENSITFTTSVDKTSLSVGETLIYRMQIKGADLQSIPAFKTPDFGNYFQVVGSEEAVTYQLFNGDLNAVKIRSLRLRALAAGSIEIPAAELRIGKERLKSQAIQVTISAAKTAIPTNTQATAAGNSLVSLSLLFSNTKPYVGEEVIVDVRLQRRVSFFGNPQYEPLQIPGTLSNPLAVDPATHESTLDGHRFYTNSIQRMVITPLSSGKLHIPSTRFGYNTGPFDRMQVIESPASEISVRPLPTQPQGITYSGAVGDFSWRMQVEKNKTQQLSPIVVAFTISGHGNLNPLTDLRVSESKDFRLYRSKSQESNKTLSDGRMQKEKQLEYIVIPQLSGELVLPTFSWTYFSPKKGQYITLNSPKTVLQVAPTTSNIATVSSNRTHNEPELADTDIRYLKALQAQPMGNTSKAILWSISLLALVSGLGRWIWQHVRTQEPHLERKQQAYSIAVKGLRDLKAHPTENSLSRAQTILLEFLGDRLGMSFLGLTHPEIKSHLLKAQVDELLIVNTLDVLEKLAFALYAPSRVDSHSKTALITEAETLLAQLKAL